MESCLTWSALYRWLYLWRLMVSTVPRRSLAERIASRQVAGRPGGGNLGEHLHRLIGSTIIIPADWKDLPRSQWPRWVVNAVWPGLRGAWEQRRRLHVRGRRFEYRVTPKVVQHFGDGILGPSTAFVKRNPEQTQRPLLPASGAEDEGVAIVADSSPAGGTARALQDIEAKARGQPRTVLVLGRYRPRRGGPPTPPRRGSLRVEFSTVHGAKGREADYVIVLDLNEGRWGFPSKVEDDPLLELVLPPVSGGAYPVCGGTASPLRGNDARTDRRIPGDGPCAAIYVCDGVAKGIRRVATDRRTRAGVPTLPQGHPPGDKW